MSRWADMPSPPDAEGEAKQVQQGLGASRWADTPSPEQDVNVQDGSADQGEGEERAGSQPDGATEDGKTSQEVDNEKADVDEAAPATEVLESKEDEPADGRESGISPLAPATAPVIDPTVEELPQVLVNTNIDTKDRSDQLIESAASPSKSRLSAPRLKKKVSWRGKACTILIPDFDYESLGRVPMSVSDVLARLQSFEDQGIDTRGFDIESDPNSDGPVHVKPIFPDESEMGVAAVNNGPKVLLPDLKKWAAYMDALTEQKLAALGVSLGADEPAPPSATDMSRQSSSQYPPLPFSPPIPPGSTNSMARPGMVRGHSHTMSVASPISPMNGPMGHMRTQSNFAGPLAFHQMQQPTNFAGLRTFSPPSQNHAQLSRLAGLQSLSPQMQQHGQQPDPQTFVPGMQAFSPHGQLLASNMNRGGSPAQLNTIREEYGSARGAGSPLYQQHSGAYLSDLNRNQSPSVPSAATPRIASLQQPLVLPELPEEDDEEDFEENKDIEPDEPSKPDVEPETPTYVPPHKRAQLNANIAVPTPRGHRHNISEGLERDVLETEQRHESQRQDWIEVTEESDESYATQDDANLKGPSFRALSPMSDEKDPLSQGISVLESPHNHKRSGSRFNGPAATTKFNPTTSFQPSSTSFTFNAPTAKANPVPSFGHSRNKSSTTFNVAAPEFKPTALEFKPAGLPALPKSDFSFSTSGPSFKPNAAPFEPSIKPPGEQQPSIFGKVEIPDIVKPARRSKAVAIVKPEDTSRKSGSGTEFEDEEGRIAQSEDRLKRQRKVDDDGDEVPRFAEPTPMPAPSNFVLKSQSEEAEPSKPSLGQPGTANDAPGSEPFEAHGVTGTIAAEPEIEASKPRHGHRHSSSLSALAKPFEPFGTQSAVRLPEHESKKSFASISELEEGELKEEGPAPTSPVDNDEQLTADYNLEQPISPILETQINSDPPPSARVDIVADAEPSFDEIDAVMRQLNEPQESDTVRDIDDISPLSSTVDHPMEGVTYIPAWSRSDAPSPSPQRRQPTFNAHGDSSFTIHERTDSAETPMNGWTDINRLNKNADAAPSDWSGFFSPQDEEKLQHRGQFFDSHIDKLIGSVVDKRLEPLEAVLKTIQSTVTKRSSSRDLLPKRSSSAIESDADDEDDSESQRQRPISRGRDKRMDMIKAAVLEAMREQGSSSQAHQPQDIQELHSVLADMKMSFARAASAGLELDDIRAVMEDVVSKQSQALVPASESNDDRSISHRREISELEGRLNETLAGALEEANRRRAVEEREVDTKRMLRLAEEELQLLRSSAGDDRSRLQAAEDEREELLRRAERAEDLHRDLEDQVKALEAEHEAAQATLEEYRMSSKKWRQDIDQATSDREELENTISSLERELEESQEMGVSMRRRLEKLHSDMASAAGQLASEKAAHQAKEDEYRIKYEDLNSRQQRDLDSRAQLEEELRTMRAGSAEAVEARVALDHLRSTNVTLEETVRQLRLDLVEQQSLAARHEHDLYDAREAGRAEVERTRLAMGMDIESANHQVNVVRSELESELAIVRAELENSKMELETAAARHARALEDEDIAKREALRKVNQASSVALEEARQRHDTTMQDLHAAHKRALDHAVEDKQRSEHFLNERLSLSDAKMQHFQDRVLHLEERLEVTKSAAQAAALKAQSKAVPATSSSSGLPEKISPQALRESILVLQEQLQERESTIDRLKARVDKDGPAELKKKDDEISWLRELLAVRSEDLTDLVNTLAQPTFDRAMVRNSAIRIRASLQMEQQEKDRFNGGSLLQSQAMASLSNFATPKAAQLGAAFNKWRSTMESSSLKNAPQAPRRAGASTPSKAPSAPPKMPPGYSAGLMTPPASNLRSTPSPETTRSLPPPQLRPESASKQDEPNPPHAFQHSREPSEVSQTSEPPLFRSQSYDNDAEDSKVHMESFEDETLDIADNEPPAFRSLEAELDGAADDDSMA